MIPVPVFDQQNFIGYYLLNIYKFILFNDFKNRHVSIHADFLQLYEIKLAREH